MAKKAKKSAVEAKSGMENTAVFETLTSGELLARYKANVAERTRLSEENKELSSLYKAAKAHEKTNSTQAKIEALTAQLEILKNSNKKMTK
jgi:nitrate/nitrite-specific signal transduction histidine kinase